MDEVARRAALADLYELPGHLLWRASARVTGAVNRILPGGTDIHAYATLLALADEEPQSQASLAKMSAVSATTLTAVAHTLQREGLVERVRAPEDRRSYSLTRTAAGREAVALWQPHVARLESELTSSLAASDAERLKEVLRQVVADRLDPRTPAAVLDSTAFLVTKAHLRSHKELLSALRPLDIEPRHYGTIRSLRIVGPATQGQLGALLEVSPATVVQIVDHLEEQGLVVRRRDASDRRAYRLHLDEASDRLVGRAEEIVAEVQEEVFGPAAGAPRRDLIRLLRRVLTDVAPS
jgi:DNA-binding MarR family transcriptional regulator